VEDEAIIAEDLRERLVRMGYEVPEPADTAERALEAVLRERPDLILMDIHIKGTADGIETAERFRERGIPLVFLTAYGDEETFRRARSSGPFAFLAKPIRDGDLRSSIEIALDRQEREQRLAESERRFRLLWDRLPLGAAILVRVGKEWRIGRANPELARIEGTTREALEGLRVETLWPGGRGRLEREIGTALREGASSPFDAAWPREGALVSRCGVVFRLSPEEPALLWRDVTESRRIEEALRLRTHELRERLKERNCLIRIARVAGDPTVPLEERLLRIASEIPSGMRSPEEARARILLQGEEYAPAPLPEGDCSLSRGILLENELLGAVEVRYPWDEEPRSAFLPEEGELLRWIADLVSDQIAAEHLQERRRDEARLLREALERPGECLLVLSPEGEILHAAAELREGSPLPEWAAGRRALLVPAPLEGRFDLRIEGRTLREGVRRREVRRASGVLAGLLVLRPEAPEGGEAS
jgi:CheY-like chemotaxis protein